MVRKFITLGCFIFLIMACRSSARHMTVNYARLSGLALEDVVLFQQNVAGSVAAIHYNSDGTYAVNLKIEKGFANALTEFSQFYLIDDPRREGHKAVEIRLLRQGGKPLADGATVTGVTSAEVLAERLKKDLEAGFGFILEQIEKFSQDIQKIPESDAYKALKRSMEDLAAEISRAEKEARDRVKGEWLPKIERKLEALRKQLQQLGREKELQPLEERVERIRRI
jgi:hypothetical protein